MSESHLVQFMYLTTTSIVSFCQLYNPAVSPKTVPVSAPEPDRQTYPLDSQ